jgi:selenide,water dikinase
MPENTKHLVLVGGGHSHALVMKEFIRQPVPGLTITLVSPHKFTPYSGMLPGLISGHYQHREIHIDLEALSRQCNAQFKIARAEALQPVNQQLILNTGETLNYDLISFDTGATPDLSPPGSEQYSTPVKPIDQFYQQWQTQLTKLQVSGLESSELQRHGMNTPHFQNHPIIISIVGSGAAGIELALAMRHKLKHDGAANIRVQIISRSDHILVGYPRKMQRYFEHTLNRHQIDVKYAFDVAEVTENTLISTSGQTIPSHLTFWCTQVRGADWLKNTGLTLSESGFIRVRPTLQTEGYDNIYAVGDVAHFIQHPLPKAGVYAVRMANTLNHNLRAAFSNLPLQEYRPQQDFLSLLACGEKVAAGCKFGLTFHGRWVWKLKDWIDRSFMQQFPSD